VKDIEWLSLTASNKQQAVGILAMPSNNDAGRCKERWWRPQVRECCAGTEVQRKWQFIWRAVRDQALHQQQQLERHDLTVQQ
jgi:hypothetical protein